MPCLDRPEKKSLRRLRTAIWLFGLGCLDACGPAGIASDGECAEGLDNCGACVNLSSSAEHCGACGAPCEPGQVCERGVCATSCGVDLTVCGRSCADLMMDSANCGACGKTCAGGEACRNGECSCNAGQIDCLGECTDVRADLQNCGACGRACASNENCLDGQCVPLDPSGGSAGTGGAGESSSGSGGADSGGTGNEAGGTLTTGGANPSGSATGAGGQGAGGGSNGACAGKTGFYVEDQKLYDRNCNEFILRGVNYPYAWYASRNLSQDFAAISGVGANVVRIVLATGDRWTRTSGSTLTSIISAAKAAKLIAVVEVHDTTGYAEQAGSVPLSQATTYWTSTDVREALLGQEAYVLVNIGNEPNGNDSTGTWASSHVTSVEALRAAGLHHTLIVDAANWGQDWENVTRNGGGASIWQADADKNIVFSVHMYDEYGSSNTVSTYFNTFLTENEAPLIVGEFAADHGPGKEVDEGAIMMFAESLGLGYMGWSWSGNGDGLGSLDITTNFDASALSAWGNTLVNGTYGLKATSKVCSVYN
jgi:mannan endo-1,4-beta-mannosidase